MVTGGVDVGAKTVKVVILEDSRIAGYSVVEAGMDRKKSVEDAYTLALQKAGISRDKVTKVTATGVGRADVPFATDAVSDIAADARGAAFFFPQAKTVVDVGAEEARAVKIDSNGRVMDFAKNEKCAAGVGSFVESMSRALETTLENMGPLSLQSDKDIPMNVTCVVFAESEVVSLIHAKTPKPDIVRAIHGAVATRTTSMVRRVGIEPEVVLIGGVAKNPGAVAMLEKALEHKVLIPEQPEITSAVGAAIIAQRAG